MWRHSIGHHNFNKKERKHKKERKGGTRLTWACSFDLGLYATTQNPPATTQQCTQTHTQTPQRTPYQMYSNTLKTTQQHTKPTRKLMQMHNNNLVNAQKHKTFRISFQMHNKITEPPRTSQKPQNNTKYCTHSENAKQCPSRQPKHPSNHRATQ